MFGYVACLWARRAFIYIISSILYINDHIQQIIKLFSQKYMFNFKLFKVVRQLCDSLKIKIIYLSKSFEFILHIDVHIYKNSVKFNQKIIIKNNMVWLWLKILFAFFSELTQCRLHPFNNKRFNCIWNISFRLCRET